MSNRPDYQVVVRGGLVRVKIYYEDVGGTERVITTAPICHRYEEDS